MKRDTLIVNIGVNLWPFSDTMWQLLLQSFIQILVLSKSPLIKPTHKLGMFSWLHLRHGQWKYTLLLFFTFFFFFCPIEKQWLKIYIPNIYLIPKYNLGVRFTPRKRYIYTNSNKETIRSTLCFFFFFNMTSLFVYECLSDGQCSLSHRKSKLSEEPYYCIAS